MGSTESRSGNPPSSSSSSSTTTSTPPAAIQHKEGAPPAAPPPPHPAATSINKTAHIYGNQTTLHQDLQALITHLHESNNSTKKGTREEEIELKLTHIAQQANWDCGVTCLQMILEYVHTITTSTTITQQNTHTHTDTHADVLDDVPPSLPRSREALLASVGTQSIWTVDLLFLLKDYIHPPTHKHTHPARQVLFATTAPGVCSHYSEIAYYAKQFETDSARVLHLFHTAKKEGLKIYEGGITWQTLRDLLLTGRVLVVLLVDSRFLRSPEGYPQIQLQTYTHTHTHTHTQGAGEAKGTATEKEESKGNTTTTTSSAPSQSHTHTHSQPPTSYCGHYILLTGYRSSPPAFFYKDPARPREGSPSDHLISVAALDEARRSEGTDEDVLVIEVPPAGVGV